MRTILNAIFSINNTGCQWRNLDSKFRLGKLFSIKGKQDTPSLLAIDSQSIKKIQFTNEETGIDGGKNVNGLGIPDAKEPYWLIRLVLHGQ